MDPISAIGIGGALVVVLMTAIFEGTHLGSLFSPTSILLIFGGTTCVSFACYTLEDLMMLPKVVPLAFRKPSMTPAQIFETISDLATVARREGLLALESYPLKLENPLLKRGLQLVVDGTEPEMLKDLLITQLVTSEQKTKHIGSIFATMGGFSPTIGIIGTVMGLVHVLGNLAEPETLGHSIAVAFLATLYGIGLANIVALPLGKKLALVAKLEAELGLIVVEGLVSIQSGDNPRTVQQKLMSLVHESEWEHVQAAAGAKEGGK